MVKRMKRQETLIVDGYNMIGAWPELARLQLNDDIQSARNLLLFELSNYRKFKEIQIIVVFDAQFVPGITKTYDQYDLQIVFTKEGETADTYIEREVEQHINPLTRVIVATSNMAEQWMIFQKGALRQSANELLMDIQYAKRQIKQDVRQYYSSKLRRRSPWEVDQLEQLDSLRMWLENRSD